jgi:hypothetical protein
VCIYHLPCVLHAFLIASSMIPLNRLLIKAITCQTPTSESALHAPRSVVVRMFNCFKRRSGSNTQ